MRKKEIIDILTGSGISPNKKLGQNFICNKNEIKRILGTVDICSGDEILEIGPGLGVLTDALMEKAGKITAVEIDSGIAEYLERKYCDYQKIKIIHGDFLKIELQNTFSKIISNLPYYCASEILFKISKDLSGTREIYVTIQKEMARRIVSKPGSKIYGALTAALGLNFDSEILFDIDKSSFYPEPRVASSFIRMIRKEHVGLNSEETKLFHDIVKSAFWGRRKTLLKALSESPHIDLERNHILELMKSLNINDKERGENLSVIQFIEMAKSIYKIKNIL